MACVAELLPAFSLCFPAGDSCLPLTSSSLIFELPFVEKYFNIDDPERFTACYYDIGEPSLQVGERALDGRIVKAESGDKLCLCRADLSKNAEEGVLDFNSAQIASTDTDFSDGISRAAAEDCILAVAGVVVPRQLQDEDILFDPANNRTGLLNRVEKVVYLVRDGSEYDSVLEFYHVFSKDEIAPDREYEVSLYGVDKNGQQVAGTSETFAIGIAR